MYHMNKKYLLTKKYITHNNHKLQRIVAIKSFGTVKEGDIGGYVEREENLSQYNNSWIYDNSKVYENAHISDDAEIRENASIGGYSTIYEDAHIFGNAIIRGSCHILGRAFVCDNSILRGEFWLTGDSKITGSSNISLKGASDIIVRLDHGYWIKIIHKHHKWYIMSSTLEMIPLMERYPLYDPKI